MRTLLTLLALLFATPAAAQPLLLRAHAPVVPLIAPNATTSATNEVFIDPNAGCKNGSSASCANGDTVATSQDQSGQGNNATKCSAGPVFAASSMLSGKPAYHYDGPSQFCLTTPYAGTVKTIMVVYYNTNNSSYGALIGGKPQAGATIPAYAIYAQAIPQNTTPGGSFSQRLFSVGNTSNSGAHTWFSNLERTSNVWSIIFMTEDGSNLRVYDHNVLMATVPIPGGSPSVYTATGQVIGADAFNNVIASWFTGMMGPVAVWNGVLSDADRAGVNAWAENYAGITPPASGPVMFANNRAIGSYTDLNLYILKSSDGKNWNAALPVNYVPTLAPGQTSAATLAPIPLHDDQGNIAKYNGRYWAQISACPFSSGLVNPCHYVKLISSTDFDPANNNGGHWADSSTGPFDCDVITGSSGSTRGCFNDGWFVDRNNSNAVSMLVNASTNEQNLAGVVEYGVAMTLNSDGSYAAGAVTAMAGSALPFGSTGTPTSGFFCEQIVYRPGASVYDAFCSNLAGQTSILWFESSSPFTGYSGANGSLAATVGTSVEWPFWSPQSGGNGTITWDSTGGVGSNKAGAATDNALGTVSGLSSFVPQVWPTGSPLAAFVPQSAAPVQTPAVVLP